MQLDQSIMNMLSGPDRGSASIRKAPQSKSSCQSTVIPDSVDKEW